MTHRIISHGKFVLPVLTLVVLSSCSQWSSNQKAQLASVRLTPTVMNAQALQPPDGSQAPGASQKVPSMTGGGIIPALIGQAIDGTVSKYQQSNFESDNQRYFDAAKRNIPNGLDRRFNDKLQANLLRNTFFKDRLNQKGQASIQSEITSYGYKRTSITEDKATLMAGQVIVQVKINGADGMNVFTQNVVGTSAFAKPMASYASDPALARQAFDSALDQAVNELDTQILKKTGK